jgi:hypothetical protein
MALEDEVKEGGEEEEDILETDDKSPKWFVRGMSMVEAAIGSC